MLLQPQEVEVFYVLPAIRRELTLSLKAQGMAQKEIARIMGVTPAAVSQYVHDKRGSDIPELREAARKAAGRITDQETLVREIQSLLQLCKDSKLTCRLHERHGEIPQGCDICFK